MKNSEYFIFDIGTQFIGVKSLDINGQNIGDIWEKKKDNYWYCVNVQKNYILEDWQINHDINLGYLKKMLNNKNV